jgi:hypothetical protein
MGDCLNAGSQHDFNICFGKKTAVTSQNVKVYEASVRSLLALKYPKFPGLPATSTPEPAGPSLTAEQQATEFDKLTADWQAYLNTACGAAFHQFGGGTGGSISCAIICANSISFMT